MQPKIDISKSRIFIDLINYTKVHPQLAMHRCEYAAIELAVQWKDKKDVTDFYKTSDLYIFDLTNYQLMLEHSGHIKNMIQQMKTLGLKKVLEYGGGIGEFSLFCNEEGLDISYYDLPSKTKDYALWRFKKHNGDKIKIAESNPLEENWDAVNIMDVLEHLEHPEQAIKKLAENAKYIFCNPENIIYNVYFPQHISKYDLTPYFEHVDTYLWKNKSLAQ